MATLYNSS